MRIDGPARTARPIPLTPLVDVVFLLLMFFMLSTTFAKHGQLGMGRNSAATAGQAAGAAEAEERPGVLVDVSHGPAIRINGRPVALADFVAALDGFHQRGVTAGIIRVRSDADVQDLVSMMELARGSKLSALTLTGR